MAVVGACQKGACKEGACRKEGNISGKVAIVRACRERACGEGTCKEGACCKGACCKEGGIGGRAGIGASSSKDAFRSFKLPLLLHRASSVVYSGGIGE